MTPDGKPSLDSVSSTSSSSSSSSSSAPTSIMPATATVIDDHQEDQQQQQRTEQGQDDDGRPHGAMPQLSLSSSSSSSSSQSTVEEMLTTTTTTTTTAGTPADSRTSPVAINDDNNHHGGDDKQDTKISKQTILEQTNNNIIRSSLVKQSNSNLFDYNGRDLNHNNQPPPEVHHHSKDTESDQDGNGTEYYYSKLPHWSENIEEYDSVPTGECLISGGSDIGRLPYFTETGDPILEIDGQQVAGWTSADIVRIMSESSHHNFKVVTGTHGLPVELREYLSRRFARGSIDHKLQELIRDNIYARTLPVTTRPPRDGEQDGIDYRFLSRQKFLEMDQAGLLLESGIYCNYLYGTPFPSSDNGNNLIGANPTAASNGDDDNDDRLPGGGTDDGSTSTTTNTPTISRRKRNRSNIVAIDAASLPYGWERISDAHYGVYYIDHINKRTQYERPYEIELVKGISGFGFALIEIDKGLIVVKSLIQGGSAAASGIIQPGDVLVSVAGVSVSGFQHSDIAHMFSTFSVGDRVRLTFARGYQLPQGINDEDYDIINLKIVKGLQGFGFTISEGHNGQKVKKVLDLERCCSLRQGDILLTINGVDLSPLSHLDVVELLKQCPVNEPTEFMVKRKRRPRSKTPMSLQAPVIDPNDPAIHVVDSARHCKTPSAEMFYSNHHQQLQQVPPRQRQPPVFRNSFGGTNHQFLESINDNNNTQTVSDYENQQTMMMSNHPVYDNSLMPMVENFSLYSNQPPMMDFNNGYGSLKSQSAPLLLNNNPIGGTVVGPSPPDLNGNGGLFGGSIDIDYEYHQVTLTRTETGFGFRIIGGSEDGSNVAIGSIVIGGAADQDGTLKAGDELIAINGQYVIGAAHHQVVQLMAETGAQVTLLVRRKRYLNAFDVTLHRHEYEGYGFVIISCGNCALIGRIIEGSPAHRCQRLHIRDRIIAVNGVDVTNLTHPEIVNKIKESDDTLHLRIVPADCYTVELIRGRNGYGFSIRGGAEFNGMPMFILAIAANGPASSLLQVGDEILEINDRSTAGMTHQEAVQLISHSTPMVRLRLRHNYGGELFNLMPPAPPINGGCGSSSSPQQLSPPSSVINNNQQPPQPFPKPNGLSNNTNNNY